jgi:hypothetical protein
MIHRTKPQPASKEAKAAAKLNKCAVIMLNKGFYTLVDKADFETLNRFVWTTDKTGRYVSRSDTSSKKRSMTYMHRILLNAKKGQEVDHVNRNKLDNRRVNLRFCTRAQNQGNVPKFNRAGLTSKFKGVVLRQGRYHARAKENYKCLYLGSFDSERDAALAYNQWASKRFGDFALLNQL